MLYNHINQMEPMTISPSPDDLINLAAELVKKAGMLNQSIHPITQASIKELVRAMNCYYSNLIEGHNTNPLDIEKALNQQLSANTEKRNLQQESLAHIKTQLAVEQKLKSDPDVDITSSDFLCWVHEIFYKNLPETFQIKTKGKFRTEEVQVGRHIAPAASALPNFMARFNQVYRLHQTNLIEQIILSACAHHRLAWIHPFLDGNGRVVRLFSDAYFAKLNLDSHGLWTISRGLGRHKSEYFTVLANADAPRQGDLDGRGNLSLKNLQEFCRFFIKCAIDQVDYMSQQLAIDNFLQRQQAYVAKQAALGNLKIESAIILRETFLRGEIQRKEIPLLTNKPERSARRITRELLDQKLIKSPSEKGPLQLAFPVKVLGYYFPNLYPDSIEVSFHDD